MELNIGQGSSGYDDNELESAKKAVESGKIKPPKEVKPRYIKIRLTDVVSTEEMGQREVFIDYDENGKVVGIQLL